MISRCGGIAQLGERLHGMQEVSGSIPLISTKSLFVLNAFLNHHKEPVVAQFIAQFCYFKFQMCNKLRRYQ
jgi:hypothetical protein